MLNLDRLERIYTEGSISSVCKSVSLRGISHYSLVTLDGVFGHLWAQLELKTNQFIEMKRGTGVDGGEQVKNPSVDPRTKEMRIPLRGGSSLTHLLRDAPFG